MIKRTAALFAALSLILWLPLQSARAANATLLWDLSASPSITAQKLLYSNTPVNPVTGRFNAPATVNVNAAATSFTLNNLANGTYYFAVVATNSSGIDSLYSNIVTHIIAAPAPPTNLRLATPTPAPRP